MSLAMEQVKTTTERDPRWRSVVNRNAAADGMFVYAVKSTGVYCRPSCPSRPAKPKNVTFYATCADAEAAGYRACRRCNPKGPSLSEAVAAVVAEACRRIEDAEEPPKLSSAIYGAGFNSNSRFYESSNEVLGMTPTAYKQGGKDADIRFAVGQCSLGAILVARSKKGICAITLGDDPDELVRDLQDRFPNANLIGADRGFERLVAQVVGFVETPRIGLDLPLDVRGTAFQQRVWQALRGIPAGKTASYAEVARRIGKPKAVRAVAQACGANKIAVAIPCHRVVKNDGVLSGYRWGVERKRALLEKEAKA